MFFSNPAWGGMFGDGQDPQDPKAQPRAEIAPPPANPQQPGSSFVDRINPFAPAATANPALVNAPGLLGAIATGRSMFDSGYGNSVKDYFGGMTQPGGVPPAPGAMMSDPATGAPGALPGLPSLPWLNHEGPPAPLATGKPPGEFVDARGDYVKKSQDNSLMKAVAQFVSI